MHIDVNGTRLWFDVDGPALVPDGPRMRERPTLVLVHGGPGGFDHSYLKPYFAELTGHAQVVYLDLRDHGRSARQAPTDWSLEACADDLRSFCDALGIVRPIVLGHSLGGFVVMLYGARHRDHAGALILQSTMARFDIERVAEGFRAVGGDEVAALARRDFGGEPVTEAESEMVFAAFGPRIPSADDQARVVGNPELNEHGMELLRRLDVVDQLAGITCPTLVCVGDLDPITPVSTSREIVEALPAGVGRLEILDGVGHFPWLDRPDRYWSVITPFLTAHSTGRR